MTDKPFIKAKNFVPCHFGVIGFYGDELIFYNYDDDAGDGSTVLDHITASEVIRPGGRYRSEVLRVLAEKELIDSADFSAWKDAQDIIQALDLLEAATEEGLAAGLTVNYNQADRLLIDARGIEAWNRGIRPKLDEIAIRLIPHTIAGHDARQRLAGIG